MAQHTLRLPDQLHQQLSALAAEQSVSVNQLVTTLIERAVGDHYVNRVFVDHCAQRTASPTLIPKHWELTSTTMLDAACTHLPHTSISWRNKAAITPVLNRVNECLRYRRPRSIVRAAGLLLTGCAAYFPFTEENVEVGIRSAVALLNVYGLETIELRDRDVASLRAVADVATHTGEPESDVVEVASRTLLPLLKNPLPDTF